MKSKLSAPLEDVYSNFQKAVDATDHPSQKVTTLALCADFLLENKAWEHAIGVYRRIAELGDEAQRLEAHIGMINAYLHLDDETKALEVFQDFSEVKGPVIESGLAAFRVKTIRSLINPRLSDFLAASPSRTSRVEQASPDPDPVGIMSPGLATAGSPKSSTETSREMLLVIPVEPTAKEENPREENSSQVFAGKSFSSAQFNEPLTRKASIPAVPEKVREEKEEIQEIPSGKEPTRKPLVESVRTIANRPPLPDDSNVPVTLADLTNNKWEKSGFNPALEKAMKSRFSASLNAMITDFEAAIAETDNPSKKATTFFLLADYLAEREAWKEAFVIYLEILQLGIPGNRHEAIYGMIKAQVAMGQEENARNLCSLLVKGETPKDLTVPTAPRSLESRVSEMLKEELKKSGPLLPPGVSPMIPGKAPKESMVKRIAIPLAEPLSAIKSTGEGEEKAVAVTDSAPPVSLPHEASQDINIDDLENRITTSVGGWKSDLTGDINALGMDLGMVDGVDVGAKTTADVAIAYDLSPRDRLRIAYTHFEHGGTLNRTVTFDGKMYIPGNSFDLKTRIFDVEGFHRIESGDGFSWGPVYGVKFVKSEMELVRMLAAVRRVGNWDMHSGLPYLGLESENRLSENLLINGSAKFFTLTRALEQNTRDLKLQFLFGRDYQKQPAAVEWYGYLGFRDFLFQGNTDETTSQVRYSGPVFGLSSQF
jgi:tetratricopeptide (TPR) repeat protein